MSYLTRDPMFCMGIGSKAIDDGHRHDNARVTNHLEEVPA
jgi:hypothetical protein